MRLNKRGQSLVEFALILPLLLLVFFSIIDGALIIQGLLTVNHAAREAARFAVTYQPLQGDCLERVVDGVVDNGYPWCPANKNEGDQDYYDRRTLIIKRIAQDRSIGLRTTTICESESCLSSDEPGMFGSRVFGFQSFEGGLQQDKPGIPGLPVRVGVVHNVPLITFSMFVADPYFRVDAEVEMVNEGVQAGNDGAPPPVGGTLPPVAPPTDPPETTEPPPTDDPTTEPTQSGLVNVELNFENALNQLPAQREHIVIATVTEDGNTLAGENVRFTIDNGSFALSGSEAIQVKFAATDGNGKAQVSIYTNAPTTAKIEAWADVNNNAIKETTELDTATKKWQATGPYLVVSDHNPEADDTIGTLMYNHDPAKNPHALWWCVSPTDPLATVALTQQLANGINVETPNGFFDAANLAVPATASGIYRIESHQSPGGCGQATSLVAVSSDIVIKELPPDLTITDVTIVSPEEDKRAPGVPMTLTIEVMNLQPVSVTTGPFDVDVYPHLEEAPYAMQLSASKQWIENLGPGETTVLTFYLEVEGIGINKLWAQVDTTGYVIESDETNNIFGPLEFETCHGSDDFDEGLESFWSIRQIGDAQGSNWIDANSALVIRNRSSSGLWSGNHNFYYVYQQIPAGDTFDARVRLIQKPAQNTWSKIGLHVREGLGRSEEYVMNMITNNQSQAGVQIGHNASRVVDDRATNLPYWARIVRQGTRYEFYGSDVPNPTEGDWIPAGSTTENTALPYIGVAHANYNNSNSGDGIVDDFIICPTIIEDNTATSGTNPPGLVECEELINVPGFEGNIDTVFEYWRARDHRQTSEEQYGGNFSVRLMASLSTNPCTQNSLDPYLYQDVQMPTSVYSISTLVVTGRYFVKGSDFECSSGNSDPLDKLTLELQGTDDSVIVPAQEIANGGVATETWHTIPITLSDSINLETYAGRTLRLYWDAYHNDNFDGTFFYVDNVNAQVCTMWPIPEDEPGTVSMGGTLTTKAASSAIRVPLPGADVWAYTQSGQTYHTVSIHDGTYHFYNLAEPGIYVVYAEAMVDGQLRTAVSTVTLNANDRNYNVNMLLQ